jgi:hypothetical protein
MRAPLRAPRTHRPCAPAHPPRCARTQRTRARLHTLDAMAAPPPITIAAVLLLPLSLPYPRCPFTRTRSCTRSLTFAPCARALARARTALAPGLRRQAAGGVRRPRVAPLSRRCRLRVAACVSASSRHAQPVRAAVCAARRVAHRPAAGARTSCTRRRRRWPQRCGRCGQVVVQRVLASLAATPRRIAPCSGACTHTHHLTRATPVDA